MRGEMKMGMSEGIKEWNKMLEGVGNIENINGDRLGGLGTGSSCSKRRCTGSIRHGNEEKGTKRDD